MPVNDDADCADVVVARIWCCHSNMGCFPAWRHDPYKMLTDQSYHIIRDKVEQSQEKLELERCWLQAAFG